jgi:hypothetical protein
MARRVGPADATLARPFGPEPRHGTPPRRSALALPHGPDLDVHGNPSWRRLVGEAAIGLNFYTVNFLPTRPDIGLRIGYRLYTAASSMSTRERFGSARPHATVTTAAKTMYAEIA